MKIIPSYRRSLGIKIYKGSFGRNKPLRKRRIPEIRPLFTFTLFVVYEVGYRLPLRIKTYRDVHQLVFVLQRGVHGNIPLAHSRQLLHPLFYKLHRVAGIENIAAAELPCINHPGGSSTVETLDFQVSHFVHVTFMELEQVADSRIRIIKFRFRFDRCGHISASAVEILDLIEIPSELNRISRSPKL